MTIYVAEVDASGPCEHEATMTLCIYCGAVLAIVDEEIETTTSTSTSNKTVYKNIDLRRAD